MGGAWCLFRFRPGLPSRSGRDGVSARDGCSAVDDMARRSTIVQLRGLLGRSRPIYTGRGKTGDQRLVGQNRDLANNRRTNYVFESGAGSRELRFLGTAASKSQWRARATGDDGREREILGYRLRFTTGGPSAGLDTKTRPGTRPSSGSGSARRQRTRRSEQHRQRRRFDPSRAPADYRTAVAKSTPEERAARQEKATKAHHDLLVRLQAALGTNG